MHFLQELKSRGELLYYFGWICLALSIIFLALAQLVPQQVAGANAWYKPFKFALSTFFYAWAMAWYVHELPQFKHHPICMGGYCAVGF